MNCRRRDEPRGRPPAVAETRPRGLAHTATDFYARKGTLAVRAAEGETSLQRVLERLSPDARRRQKRVAEALLAAPGQQLTFSAAELGRLLLRMECETCAQLERADELRERAVRLLSAENFNPQDYPPTEADLLMLYQKEALLNNVLEILGKDNVDTNALLLNAFEKIQCDNYIPPTDRPLLQKGYFVLEERVRARPAQWRACRDLAEELRLDLSGVEPPTPRED